MAPNPISTILFTILASLLVLSSAQSCSNYTFTSNKHFNSCIDLPSHNAHLHWNYFPTTDIVSIAYRADQNSDGWVAWAINPTQMGMVGSQALVAFLNSDGSMTTYTTSIPSYSPSMQPASLSFQVSNMSAEYSNNEMIIFAVLGPFANQTSFNHVWQAGDSVSNGVPQMHPTSQSNLMSFGEIDFISGCN